MSALIAQHTTLSWGVQLLLVGLPAFGLGVVIGVISERRKGEVMGYTRTARIWFDRWAPALYLMVAVLALIGIFISTAATITNGRQDVERAAEAKVRDDQQRGLLACFDEFAAQLAGGLPPIREASAARDVAQGNRDSALQQVVSLIVVGATRPPADEAASRQEFLDALEQLRVAGVELEEATAAVQAAREEHPFPPAPSTFCTVQP